VADVDVGAASDVVETMVEKEEAAVVDEVDAAAALEELLESLPVGVSPARMHPVLSVRAFGQVTCT